MLTKGYYSFAFIFILLAFQLACGQNQSTPNNQEKADENPDLRTKILKNQADQLIDAFNKNDFDKFAELTHPKVIEQVGGREDLISIMKTVAEQNPKVFETFSMSLGNPGKLVEMEGLLLGVVPQKIEGMTHGKHKVVQNACFVGVSNDNGKTWKFVSGEKFEEIFPSLKGKLQIVAEKTFVDGVEQ